MRTEQRERIIKDEYTVYIAEDGTKFMSENECKKYEQTAEAVINTAFERTKFGNPLWNEGEDWFIFGCEEDLFCVHITDENDLHDVNMWAQTKKLIRHTTCEKVQFGHDAIGTIQVIGDDNYGTYYSYGSIEELKAYIYDKTDKMIAELITPKEDAEKK